MSLLTHCSLALSHWYVDVGVYVCVSDQTTKSWSVLFPQQDDVIKWKHFPRCWPFVLGIHRSPVNSTHKGQWRGALMFSLICVWINGWVNKSWGWRFETLSPPLWRHRNETVQDSSGLMQISYLSRRKAVDFLHSTDRNLRNTLQFCWIILTICISVLLLCQQRKMK